MRMMVKMKGESEVPGMKNESCQIQLGPCVTITNYKLIKFVTEDSIA